MASYTQVLALADRVHNYAARLDGTFDVDKVEVTGSDRRPPATTGRSGWPGHRSSVGERRVRDREWAALGLSSAREVT